MQTSAALLSLFVMFMLSASPRASAWATKEQSAPAARQLAAVRGEVVRVKPQSKDTLLITVRPAKEFGEVTVLARANDMVGSAVGHAGDVDLLGLLSDDSRDDETITAAELNEGDVVSVI